MRLKNLYKYLIEDRKHNFQEWYNTYKEFFAQVEKMQKRIESGYHLSQDDESFLKQLLYDRYNGIASSGQSVLSKENFQKLSENPRRAASRVAKRPSH